MYKIFNITSLLILTTFALLIPHTTHSHPVFSTNASWYGPGFHGKKTASGEKFNMNAKTVAHKTLPLGTKVKITCKATGKSVVARVNDRGPYVHGRGLDLSYGTAKALGTTKKGVTTVKYNVIK